MSEDPSDYAKTLLKIGERTINALYDTAMTRQWTEEEAILLQSVAKFMSGYYRLQTWFIEKQIEKNWEQDDNIK